MTIEPLQMPPERGPADIAADVIAAAAPMLPLVGGPAERLLDLLMGPPIERRRDQWLAALVEVVRDLQERADRPVEEIFAEPAFATAVLEASRIALGEHLETKLEMLKACLMNMALPHGLPDFLAMRFLRFVDELEPEHFLVLLYCQDPEKWLRERGLHDQPATLTRRNLIERAELGLPGPVLVVALRDLADRGLVDFDRADSTRSGESMFDPWITDLGRDLLAWVTIV